MNARRSRQRDRTGRCEHGAASIWVLACCSLLLVVASVATIRGLAVLARHRAESAADLAALAAAGEIGISDRECAAARRVAVGNGARLASCRVRLAADGRSGDVLIQVIVPVRLPFLDGATVRASAFAGRGVPPSSYTFHDSHIDGGQRDQAVDRHR